MKAKNIKKMLAVISAAASTAAFSTSPAMTTTAVQTVPELTTTVTEFVPLYGDVNLDQDIGLPDLIQLQRFLLGQNDGLGSWLNADLYEDGVIDIYDLAMLKQEILGENDSLGGTVTVKVVDVMSGESLDNTRISLVGLNETYAYPLSEWRYDHSKEEEQTLHGLPTNPEYTYMIDLSNLPAGYGTDTISI